MRKPVFFAAILAFALLAACSRNQSEEASTMPDAVPADEPVTQPVPQVDTAITPAPPVASNRAQEPVPPAPVVDGMYVIYKCDDGTEPRITFSGNLVKVELTVESKAVVLSARASATNMSDTYSDDTLTLHRDGLGVTLDSGGKTTRCTESQASA
ncbi:MAG: hypothetical protein LH470_08490 [Lysobacter sp.]|nr:hypothetical protein [Lysobacter sp.]